MLTLKINNDTIAWLKVNGTDIEYAVVKANDNSYYLDHNFEKEYNKAGWIFADYKNVLDGTDKNIIIYGHNMGNGTMFGTLKTVLDSSWRKNADNMIVNFDLNNQSYKFKIFSK